MTTKVHVLAFVSVLAVALFVSKNCIAQVPAGDSNLNPSPGSNTCHAFNGSISCALLYPGFTPGGAEDQCASSPCFVTGGGTCPRPAGGADLAYWRANPISAQWNNLGELVVPSEPPPKEKVEPANAWYCMEAWKCKCRMVGFLGSTFTCETDNVGPPDAVTWIIDWSLVPVNACASTGGGGGEG